MFTTKARRVYGTSQPKAHQLVGQAKRIAAKIRPKAAGSDIFGRFPNLDKCRSAVAGDVISGEAVDYVGMDVCATFAESALNSGRIILLFGRPDPFYASILSSI